MSLFLRVKTVEEVMDLLDLLNPLPSEMVPLERSRDRVLSEDITAVDSVPHFNRSLMDGFALRAQDTFGASENLPALLKLTGEIAVGENISFSIDAGEAAAIPTGGMLPKGADAVVMVEYTTYVDEKTIEVIRPVAPGENVLRVGEDIGRGEILLTRGRRLRSQDIGMLASIGLDQIQVYRRPRVAVLSTGDEIVPVATSKVPPGKVRDINSYTLASQIEATGGIVGRIDLIRDDLDELIRNCREAFLDHDLVVLSGGSSVGMRDFTARVLDSLPDVELLVHGVAVRPGKPTILARIGDKLFWGLPGQPAAAMMTCRTFVLPTVNLLQGYDPRKHAWSDRTTLTGILETRIPSVHGRADYVPVSVITRDDRKMVRPLFGKSAMISLLGRADGFIVIPTHSEGLSEGTLVEVSLFS